MMIFGKGTPPNKKVQDAAFGELMRKLEDWTIPKEALERVHDGARASLAEVKALTEYEDGKISRLLTIIAFLSAVVGAVFTRFATDYPWPGFHALASNGLLALTIAAYFAFFAYVLLVTYAVLVILGAVKPRFNVPKSWTAAGEGLPKSMLFYERILDISAPSWGDAFVKLGADDGLPLKAHYAKCYIAESYLVAGKVADKLRVLSPGVTALQVAMGILLLFFFLCGANVVLVQSPQPISGQQASAQAVPPRNTSPGAATSPMLPAASPARSATSTMPPAASATPPALPSTPPASTSR